MKLRADGKIARYLEALDEDAKATLLALKAATRLRNDYDLVG